MKDIDMQETIWKERCVEIFGLAVVLFFMTSTGHADAFDTLTEASIQQKIGAVIKLMASIFGPIGIVFCLFRAGWEHFSEEQANVVGWIKRAGIGALLTLGCWGIGQLMVSVMK